MGEEFLGSSTAIDSSNIGFQVFEYNFVVFFFLFKLPFLCRTLRCLFKGLIVFAAFEETRVERRNWAWNFSAG